MSEQSRRPMPGVYWLPESVRRALRFEQTMHLVGECGTPEPEVEVPPLAWPTDVEAFDKARAAREHEVLYSVPAPVATEEDFAAYYASAAKEVKNHPCRIDGCLHWAAFPGDLCPVCSDDRRRMGLLPQYPSTGDAA